MKKESDLIFNTNCKGDNNFQVIIERNFEINYNLDIRADYEINRLANSNKIKKTNINKILASLLINERDLIIFKRSNNKIIKKELIFIRKVYGDFKCYYRELSHFFINNQNYYNYCRKYIFNYINANKDIYDLEYSYIIKNGQICDCDNYIKMINQNGFFAYEIEIMLSAKIFKINIITIFRNIKFPKFKLNIGF